MTRARKERVFLAVPDRAGWCRLELLPFVAAAYERNHDPAYPATFHVAGLRGADSWALAFNEAATLAVGRDFDWLWLWDSDMAPSLAVFDLLLIEGDYPIRAVSVRNMIYDRPSGLHVPALLSGDALPDRPDLVVLPYDHPVAVPYRVTRVATGGLLIHRRVLTDPAMYYADPVPGEPLPLFEDARRVGGRLAQSCDYLFCARAVAAGHGICVDPRAVVEHVKELGVGQVHAFGLHVAAALRRGETEHDVSPVGR